MELYILDTSLKRDSVIDDFVSAIWAERYSSVGDFELVMRSFSEVRRRFQVNAFLACNESHRVMVIETIEDKEDDQGEKLLTISGRSLEKVLMDRIAKASLNGLDTDGKWTIRWLNISQNQWLENVEIVDGGKWILLQTPGINHSVALVLPGDHEINY